MSQRQNKSVEFYAPYLWDRVLCMCNLFMEINKEKKHFLFSKLWWLKLFWAVRNVENVFCTPTTS